MTILASIRSLPPLSWVAVVAFLWLVSCAPKPRNVLMVTLDTTRADYLGSYNPSRTGVTPALDALAADGVQFMACFAQSGATPISHASIFSGLFPFSHGVRVIYAESGYRLEEDVPYLPELMRNAGWETAAFVSSFTVSDFYGFDRGFDVFDSGLQVVDEVLRERRSFFAWDLSANQRRSDRTTDAALAWGTKRRSPSWTCSLAG